MVCKETASIRPLPGRYFHSPAWPRPTIAFSGLIGPLPWHHPLPRLPPVFSVQITYGTICIYLNMEMLPVQLTHLSLSAIGTPGCAIWSNSDSLLIQPASTDPIRATPHRPHFLPPRLPSTHRPRRVRQPPPLSSIVHNGTALSPPSSSLRPHALPVTNHTHKNNPE